VGPVTRRKGWVFTPVAAVKGIQMDSHCEMRELSE
jgi:hypothetical protein